MTKDIKTHLVVFITRGLLLVALLHFTKFDCNVRRIVVEMKQHSSYGINTEYCGSTCAHSCVGGIRRSFQINPNEHYLYFDK